MDGYDEPDEDQASGSPGAGGDGGSGPQAAPDTPDATTPLLDASVAPSIPPTPGAPIGTVPTTAQPGFLQPGMAPAWLDAGAPDVCQGLGPERCQQTSGCSILRLSAVDLANSCSTSETRPVCARSLICLLFGTTLASDPSGQVFSVPVGCLPNGYQTLPQPLFPRESPCPSAAAQAACARHQDQRSCVGDLNFSCTFSTATSYDPVNQCVGGDQAKFQFLRCRAQSAALGGTAYYREPQGQIWSVPAAAVEAVPASWSPIAPSSVLPDAGVDLPVCLIPL